MRHVPGVPNHELPDALSRRFPEPDDEAAVDADVLIEPHLVFTLQSGGEGVADGVGDGVGGGHQQQYEGDWQLAKAYLETLSFSKGSSTELKRRLRSMINRLFVSKGQLYRRQKGRAPLLVISALDEREKLLHEAHEKLGHRGRDAIFGLLSQRFSGALPHYFLLFPNDKLSTCTKSEHGH